MPGKQVSQLEADIKLNFIDDNRWSYLLNGLLVTLEITLAATLLGIVIGVGVATVRSTWDQNSENMHPGLGKNAMGLMNSVCKFYLTVIRGTPMVIQLMIMYYIIFASSRNGVMIAMLAFGINSGAYVAEIIRAGIQAVDFGQTEAALSCGMTFGQCMRYIVLPQAVKNILPAIGNEFVTMVKETSIIQYLGISDLMYNNGIVVTSTYNPLPCYYISALIYLTLNVVLGRGLNIFEMRLKQSER